MLYFLNENMVQNVGLVAMWALHLALRIYIYTAYCDKCIILLKASDE